LRRVAAARYQTQSSWTFLTKSKRCGLQLRELSAGRADAFRIKGLSEGGSKVRPLASLKGSTMPNVNSTLGSAAAVTGAPGVVQECRLGPPEHHKGPSVFLDYDQLELDAAYDQTYYEPLIRQTYARLASNSEAVRIRLGAPRQVAYGPTEIEKLDIFRTDRAKAPIFVFIHGGNWYALTASNFGYAAEMFTKAGAHYIVPDFTSVTDVRGI
jgi:hypothetical protein